MLARCLNVDYVWIDSLCIIQDDEDDWNSESASMAEIYANSLFTVSVASAETPTAGFFGPRRRFKTHTVPAVIEPFPWVNGMDIQRDSKSMGQLVVREILPHDVLDLDVSKNTAGSLPLFGRAWTFQERLLSSRTVHFTTQEMMWNV